MTSFHIRGLIKNTVTKLNKWYPRTKDIKRVPCIISPDKFEAEYVRKNRPAILTGCSTNWRAQSEWSMMSLLGLEKGEKEWFTEYFIDSEQLGDKTLIRRNTKGKEVLELLSKKNQFRIVDTIGPRSAMFGRQ